MSAQLREVFARAREEKRAVFVPYITAGYPAPECTVPLLLAMEKAGADVIEVGVPFSDPLADGPTIQSANTVSLKHKTNYSDCLNYVREARKQGLKAPIIFMGYINPLLQYGEKRAVVDAKEAGVNGFIVVDLPLEEEPDFFVECRNQGLSFVPLIAPTTRDERIPRLLQSADSFIYFVSVAGVTGKRKELPPSLPANVERVRSFFTGDQERLPIVVGFGISTREHFVQVESIADGVVIGSAVIRAASDPDTCVDEVSAFIRNVTGRD